MTEPNLLTLMCSLIMLLIAVGLRLILKSWFVPGAIFALYWGLVTLVAQLALPSDLISIDALTWIILGVLAVGIGNLCSPIFTNRRQMLQPAAPVSNPTLLSRIVLWSTVGSIVSTVLGIIYNFVSTQLLGYSFQDAFESATSLASTANALSVLRYSQGYDLPTEIQLLLTFIYLGPIYGGTVAASAKSWRYWLVSVVSLVPAVMLSLVRTQRGTLFMALILWIAAYIAFSVMHRRIRMFTVRTFFLGLIGLGLVIFIASTAALLRINSTSVDRLEFLSPKLLGATFGYLPAFSQWWEQQQTEFFLNTLGMGGNTFAGILDLLQISVRQLGLYTDFIRLQNGTLVNIYTIFRPLILDFSPAGALLILSFVGAVAGHAYNLVTRAKLMAIPILVTYYAIMFWSFVTSLLVFNSILFAILIYSLTIFAAIGFRARSRVPDLIPERNQSFVPHKLGARES